MSGVRVLGNIIWVIFGGFFIFLHYLISSILLFLTLIGIPFGFQTMKIGAMALWPFGKEAVPKEIGSGCLNTFMNLIWIFTGGIWLALHHFIWSLFFFITIIGIPFGLQHMKLAGLALSPFGKEIIDIPLEETGNRKAMVDKPAQPELKKEDVPLPPAPGPGNSGTQIEEENKYDKQQYSGGPMGMGMPIPMKPPVTPGSFQPPAVSTVLEFYSGEHAGSKVPLKASQNIIIGREALKCNIVIADPMISRMHLVISYDPERSQFLVKDLESSHGTYINGSRMNKGSELYVPAGTRIELAGNIAGFYVNVY